MRTKVETEQGTAKMENQQRSKNARLKPLIIIDNEMNPHDFDATFKKHEKGIRTSYIKALIYAFYQKQDVTCSATLVNKITLSKIDISIELKNAVNILNSNIKFFVENEYFEEAEICKKALDTIFNPANKNEYSRV